MRKTALFVFLLSLYPCLTFALNPHATYQEAVNDGRNGGWGVPDTPAENLATFFIVLSLVVGIYLWWSSSSPLRRWVEKNGALAFWLLIFGLPLLVMVIAGQAIK